MRIGVVKFDWFLLGLGAAVALAWAFPQPGAPGGWLRPELLTKLGVALIFFLHGVSLSFTSLKLGAMNWRLHLLVQASTFLLFPVLGLALVSAIGSWVSLELKFGLFFLCALPSTVSSSVAMTAAARGNVAAAVFNATLSSLLGVLLTPLWMAYALKTSGHAPPLGPVIMDLVQWLVLPLVFGQLCRPVLATWAVWNKASINRVDRLTILLLVYTSFCGSFQAGLWSRHGGGTLALVAVLSLLLFALVMMAMAFAADAFGFAREDKITAMFCGSKKTLASGVPMAKLIFASDPGLGLILLPIMIYHSLQLIVGGVLAERWAKRPD